MVAAIVGLGLGAARGQSTYQIQGATFGDTGQVVIPAGVPGGVLMLRGTLPTALQQAQSSLLACFYTGYGSTAPFPLSLPDSAFTEPLTVPASIIQSIPPTAFTAANHYLVTGYVYFVQSDALCDGTFDAALTNRFAVRIVAPVLGPYTGPTTIPQTNSVTGVQAAPTVIPFNGVEFVAGSTVTFGAFGSVPVRLRPNSAPGGLPTLSVAVPAAFAASPVGTTATLSFCNPGAGTTTFCSTQQTPLTLTVAALNTSAGTVTASPSPVLITGQTVLTAQFGKGAAQTGGEPGAPSGPVNFGVTGVQLPPATLVLDTTAAFVPVTSSLTTPQTPSPVFSPVAGGYVDTVTVAISDAAAGAAIHYTQDGSTPTTASTLYTGPITITSTQTITAIAAMAGSLNSAAATAGYTVTYSPPAKLAFAVQPANTQTATQFAQAVQVAVEDASGNVVTNSTVPVTLAIAANPGNGTLAGTTTVNAVNGIATFADLSIASIGDGYVLRATSGTLTRATSSVFNVTPYQIALTLQSALIGIGSTLTGSFTLGHAAPAGGLVVALGSSVPANVTISPATVTVAQGQTMGNFTYAGVAAGVSNLTASATNYQTATVVATGTSAQVSLGTIPPVAPGQMVSLAVSLATAAPAGGNTITFTSSNPNVATVTSSLFVPAGQRTGAVNPQITGVIIGTTTITANAPGYAPDTRAVNVTVVATFSPGSVAINLAPSTNTKLNISAPAQKGGLTFTLSSDDPTKVTVPASVTVIEGSTSVAVPFTGVADGTTTIRADAPGVTEATAGVTVSSTFNVTNPTAGFNLQTPIDFYTPSNPATPVTVTITIANPAIATLSKSQTVVGTTTQTFTNVTSNYIGRLYVQGQTMGRTSISVSAPGYTTGSGTVSVFPSGFGFYPSTYDFSTTTFSSPTTVYVYTETLDPTSLNINTYGQPLNPGIGTVSVPVTSDTAAVGTITTSPVVFHANEGVETTQFKPAGTAGTSTLAIGAAPAGFSTLSQMQYRQITATVSAPAITVGNPITGSHLYTPYNVYLPVAPPSGVTVTVTSGTAANATLSLSSTTAGTASVSFSNVTSTYVGTVYVQGQATGSSVLTVAAVGYTSGTGTISTYPSGFSFYPSTYNFSTTTLSAPSNLYVYTTVLNPGSLTIYTYGLPINPGYGPVNVSLTSSSTTVGTVTTSPLVFNSGDGSETTTFKPAAAGTSNLTVGTPANFSTPSQTQYVTITATVSSPVISVSNVIAGAHLQTYVDIYLPVAPPSGTTVTVTSGTPSTATISSSTTAMGGSTLTFNNVTSAYVGRIYVQGQTTGSSTLTVTATGYTSGSGTISVYPSGFGYYPSTGNFTTTTFSAPNPVYVYTEVLNPGSLTIYTYGQPLNPGSTAVNVSITSSATSVGTLGASQLTFNAGDGSQTTTFAPQAAGTTNLTLGVPTGFSTPSQTQYEQVTATVTAPSISIGGAVVGVNLQTYVDVYLSTAPPNSVNVLVTTAGPLVATVSQSATVVGGSSVSFSGVTGSYVGRIYIQGQALGSTNLTVSAAGYTNGNSTVTTNPSGFAFYPSTYDFTTSATSSANTIYVYSEVLNPGTFTIYTYGELLNPGLGDISVPVTSSATTVGTITSSPVIFHAGEGSETTTFKPAATGSSTLSVGTPSGFSSPSQYTTVTATVQ